MRAWQERRSGANKQASERILLHSGCTDGMGNNRGSTGTLCHWNSAGPGSALQGRLAASREGEDSLGPSARAGSTDILSHPSFWLGFTRSLLISSGCGHTPYKLWPDMAEGQSLWSTYCDLDEERPSPPTPLSRVPAVCTPNRPGFASGEDKLLEHVPVLLGRGNVVEFLQVAGPVRSAALSR